jgi:class 3 adenylate cyclase/tetratricopeptide (TPR) repeat protein
MGAHWFPFVPASAMRLLSRLPATLPVSHCEHAVVLFADLAGFTPLSEALAALGPAGGEAMRTLLNQYFGVLIEQIGEDGGDVATFAGDAITAVFPYRADRPSERADAIGSAVWCASAMQRRLADVPAVPTPHGDLRPGMKIGLAAGRVVHAVVGDPAVRLLYVLTGRPLQDAAAAERRCREAEMVLDPALADDEPSIGTAPRSEYRLLGPAPPDRLPRTQLMTTQAPMDPAVRTALLHPALTGRFGNRGHGLGGEHRTVTSAFVVLPDQDVPRDGGARLQAYAAIAVPSVARYGGDLRQIDAGDKGYQLVLDFGVPRSHADDAERAVACCLELMQLPGGPYRAGVATGQVFCGEVGTDLRRDYTVLGDSVNLAARLAHSARPGELLVDARTAARVGAVVRQGRAGPLTVKGKSGPVEVRSVRGLRDPARPLLAGRPAGSVFAGRADELAAARACLEKAGIGRGQVLTVVGHPGIGKSHLVEQIVTAARDDGWVCYGGAGGSPADRRGYLLWRPVWRALLGLPDGDTQAEQAAARAATTDPAGTVDERMPLLGPVLGVPLPDNELTASLDGSARAQLTRGLLLDCLRRKAAAERLVMVLEDCHWIDEPSRALLTFLAPHLSDLPVLLVVVARDEPATGGLLEALHDLPHSTRLRLRELPPAAARLVVRDRLQRLYGTQTIPDRLVDRLVGRGAGNPFFLAELAGYVRDREPDPEQVAAVPLPEDVRRLVVARLDALAPEDHLVITAASVIGTTFRPSWVRGCLPAAGTDPEVADRLNRLAQLDLVRLSRTAPEPEYDFTHSITHEVAYTILDSETRTTLHEAVAAHIERAHPDQPAQYADVLAHHYGRTRNTVKQRTWFRAAADAAQAAYANDAAIDYYRRLLPLLPPAATAEALVRLGSVLQLTGRWAEAEDMFRRALRQASANADRPTLAGARRSLGILLTATRAYEEAGRQLTTAAAEFTALGDDDGVMWTLDRLAFALYQHGDYPAALEVAERQLAGHRALGDLAGMSAAADNIGMVHWLSGDHEKALDLLRWSCHLGEQSGDARITVHAANDLAGLLADRGDHRQAVEYLQRAVAAAHRIGYRQLVMTLTRNAGEIYRERGAFDEAARCYTVALQGALELGAWTTIGHCVAGLATAAAESGQPGSERLLVRAIALTEALQCQFLLAELWHLRGQLAEREGRLVEAERFCAQAEDVATRLNARSLLPRIRALRLRLGVVLGTCEPDNAVRELTEMLAEWTDPPEQALLHATMSALDPRATSSRDWAAELYRKLYEHAPSVGYAAAFRRLTGETLLPPAALPPLGIADATAPSDVEALLAQIERLSASRDLSRSA